MKRAAPRTNRVKRVRLAARHRYRPESAYTRGSETRLRLVAAAFELFCERGYAAASTRDIAAAAGLNAPALQYYFNNKEGLYAACAEHFVARVWDALKDVVIRAERLADATADAGALIEAFCAVQERLADVMNDPTVDIRLWMLEERAGLGPPSGFQRIYRRTRRITGALAALVARLRGRARADDESVVMALCLSGQVFYFYCMRRSALAALGRRQIDAERLDMIKRAVRENTIAALRSMAERGAQAAGGAGGGRRSAKPRRARKTPVSQPSRRG
jgi:AcrR family transcriptional regulator